MDENSGAQKEMDMGTLFDSLSEKDSVPRQRRSQSSTKREMSYSRQLARFRRFPSLEIEISD